MLKSNEVTALRNEANKAKIQGDNERAIECLEKVCNLEPDDANNLKELGSLYNRTGNKKKAVEFYWKALEKYREAEYYQNATAIAQMLLRFGEDELLVKHELAFLYEKQGLLGDAVSAYEELAELYKKEGDIEGVLENLRKIVNITPKKLGIRLKLAEIYENQKKFDELVAELEEIKGIFKEQGRVEEVERLEARIATLTSKAGKDVTLEKEEKQEVKKQKVPEDLVVEFEQEGIGLIEAAEGQVSGKKGEKPDESLLESAEGLFDMGEEEEEEEELRFFEELPVSHEEAIEVAVSGWEDWLNLAELYESVGSVEESVEYYVKAAEANFKRKDYSSAYKIFNKIAGLQSSNIMCRQKMIQSALKLNDTGKAIEAYFSLYECLKAKKADSEAEKILAKIENLDPNSAVLGKVRGKKKKAEKVEAVESPDFEGLFEAEVSEQMSLEEETEVKAPTLETLLEEFKNKAKEELDITDYAAHFNLGITYKEMDLIEEAIEEFKKAMKEKSWRLKSLEMLGICHELLDQREKAEDIFKLVINNTNFREDQKTAFYYHLGNLYGKQGLYGDAVEQYKRIVKIDRDFADVKEKIKIINKKMAGEEVDDEISLHFGEALSEEGADLWDSVLAEGIKEEKAREAEEEHEEETKAASPKKKGKISYI
jgi:tetratricopeptide (TPR) repeat protein